MMMMMKNEREGGLHVCFHSSTCCRFVISGDKNSLQLESYSLLSHCEYFLFLLSLTCCCFKSQTEEIKQDPTARLIGE